MRFHEFSTEDDYEYANKRPKRIGGSNRILRPVFTYYVNHDSSLER
jgi:hypothetical protein